MRQNAPPPKEKPRLRESAAGFLNVLSWPAGHLENTSSPEALQATVLIRRYGVSTVCAATIARLAYDGGRP